MKHRNIFRGGRYASLVVAACAALGLAALPEAAAQPCDVELSGPHEVHDGNCMLVRAAWDRANDVPVVMWLDLDSGDVAFSRFEGPEDTSWAAPVVVDRGGVFVPGTIYGLRGYRMAVQAFDDESMAHVIMAGKASESAAQVDLYYVRQTGEATWSEPEMIVNLPDEIDGSGGEILLQADFDSAWNLHLVCLLYGLGRPFALRREGGTWTEPQDILNGGYGGLDMALDLDDRLHIITEGSAGGGHQAFYKKSGPGGVWTAPGDEQQITFEEPINCLAGPLACWPALAVDISAEVHVAYGLDPDPCCDLAVDDPSVDCREGANPHDYDEVENNGTVRYMKTEGGVFPSVGREVLDQVKLHGPYPQVVVDPVGVIYVFSTNQTAGVAYDAKTGSFESEIWMSTRHDWYFQEAVATGGGGWYAYILGRNSGPVNVIHMRRTGDCGEEALCSPPGDTEPCGECGLRTCRHNNTWGPCEEPAECPEADVADVADIADIADIAELADIVTEPDAATDAPMIDVTHDPSTDGGEQIDGGGATGGGCSCALAV